ncbi:type VI secretion system protein TssA [Methylomonas koyamae]|uniref:Type VI secretion protein n=1 Tax=Methylomonas koyamae TaxID=702114 RepID=A0A291IPL7_9GAMM|nr:type VI secretion system protein TssA [Methylomonas koyamae]ATG92164.1 type VI secretion system protein ImpA [Methylomonas koyamae]OAI27359.1 type VI secretion protein [Methylomonas koyamae]
MADLSGLLNEISPDNPCGDNLEYDAARIALDTDIQGTPENQFTGEKAMPPNWRDIQKQTIALLERSRDLQVILYLIRALIPLEGLAGFRDGLGLLQESVNRYWDSIHPQLDPDDGLDPTLRINIIEELVNFDWIIRPLSLTPLVESKAVGRFCLRDIQYATDKLEPPEGVAKPDINAIKAAFLDVDGEELAATFRAIGESSASVAQLENFVSEKVGVGQGANLSALRSLLKEISYQFDQLAGSRLVGEAEEAGEDAGADAEDEAGAGAKAPAKVKQAAGTIETRADVVRTLDLLCKYYAENEPSSPVPILLQRAKYLATADFLSIVNNLMPDALSQIDLIKGPDLN